MKKCAFLAILMIAISLPAIADEKTLKGRLFGFEEVPSISTTAGGEFTARISNDETSIEYDLTYDGTQGVVTQAHLHLAQQGANGGITVFLCTNLGNGPAGTQACPVAPATISGAITATDVSPNIPATQPAILQGLGTGELAELINALREGSIYVNVHSTLFPGGEIRSQVHPGEKRRKQQ